MRRTFFYLIVLLVFSCNERSGKADRKNIPVTKDYPTQPVRLIEPFGAGGGPDLIARAISPKLSKLWGQPVTVENHPGDGSTAAPALVAKSPADSYTLLVNTNAQAYSAALVMNLPYDPLKDFVPIAPLTNQPYVLLTGKVSGIKTVSELIAAAKRQKGQMKFGTTGLGTGTHIGLEKFNLEAGITATHVPAQKGEAITDVIARTLEGRFTYMLAPIQLVLKDIHDGKLVALGVTTKQRSILLPDVPSIAEAGVADFDYAIWYGIWAPAGTPAETVDKLSKDIGHVLQTADMRDWFKQHGADVMNMTLILMGYGSGCLMRKAFISHARGYHQADNL